MLSPREAEGGGQVELASDVRGKLALPILDGNFGVVDC